MVLEAVNVGVSDGCSNEHRELFRNHHAALGPELCEAESGLGPNELAPTDLRSRLAPAGRLGPLQPQRQASIPPTAAHWRLGNNSSCRLKKSRPTLEWYLGGGAACVCLQLQVNIHTRGRLPHNNLVATPQHAPTLINAFCSRATRHFHNGDCDTAWRWRRKCDVQGTCSPLAPRCARCPPRHLGSCC